MIRLPAFRTGAILSVLAAFVVTGAAITTATPATARVDISFGFNAGGINFGYFHNDLRRYGRWIDHPRWGDAWQPPHACSYRPYFNGYFEYSRDGLFWVGYDPWSDITDHYGRWVRDPRFCVLWIPGYVWAPAWVVFREGGGYIGWFPAPPNYGDFDDGPYFGGRADWDNWYGYRDQYGRDSNGFFNLWVFVPEDHFYRRDWRSYAVESSRVRGLIPHTQDITHYAVENDHIVNRSLTTERLESIAHRHIEPLPPERLMKHNVPIAPVSSGRNLAHQENSGHAGPHLHDRDLRPVNTPAGNENAPNGGPGHERMNGPGATPAPQPLPNAGEERGRGKRGGGNEATPAPQATPTPGSEEGGRGKRGGGNEATPAPQATPTPGGEEGGRGKRGGGNEATPAPQTTPTPGGEEGGRGKRGGGNEATPAPQTTPTPGGEEGGRGKRGGGNEATPAPQTTPTPGGEEGGRGKRGGGNEATPAPEATPSPSGEERGRVRHGGNPENQASPAASPEPQAPQSEGKKKENKAANPEEDKKKHPDNENGPGR